MDTDKSGLKLSDSAIRACIEIAGLSSFAKDAQRELDAIYARCMVLEANLNYIRSVCDNMLDTGEGEGFQIRCGGCNEVMISISELDAHSCISVVDEAGP